MFDMWLMNMALAFRITDSVASVQGLRNKRHVGYASVKMMNVFGDTAGLSHV